jgi:hypothetical protein
MVCYRQAWEEQGSLELDSTTLQANRQPWHYPAVCTGELVRGGSDAAVLEVLAPLRRAVRGDLRAAAAGLADADGDADGALNALEVLHWMRGLVPGEWSDRRGVPSRAGCVCKV